MPRVPEITDSDGDATLDRLFGNERNMFGDLLNPTKVMAHCPPILAAAKNLYAAFPESGLVPSSLHALIHVRVASINGCPFWVDINSVRAIEADGGEEKVAALANWRDSEVYTPQERAALEYGERMTITGQTVGDDLFAQLKRYFDDAQIVELTAGIAMENFRSKFNAPLQVESQGFCLLAKDSD